MKESVAFLYASNEQSVKEIKKTSSFTIISKRVSYLGINLMQKVKDKHWKLQIFLKDITNEKTFYIHRLENLIASTCQ